MPRAQTARRRRALSLTIRTATVRPRVRFVRPQVVVVEWTRGKSDYALLPTVARSGMTFEVGACPWGCLVADRYAQVRSFVSRLVCVSVWYIVLHSFNTVCANIDAQSRRLILSALDFIEAHNNALKTVPRPPTVSLTMNIFTPVSSISYPEVF